MPLPKVRNMLTSFMDQFEHWDFQPISKQQQTNPNENMTNPQIDNIESRPKEKPNTSKAAKGQLISKGHFGVFNDLSIGSTATKYIRLNTKTQNIICCVNENLTTFLYTLTGGTRKQKEKKVFSFKVYTKVECYQKKSGFQYLVLCIWFQ